MLIWNCEWPLHYPLRTNNFLGTPVPFSQWKGTMLAYGRARDLSLSYEKYKWALFMTFKENIEKLFLSSLFIYLFFFFGGGSYLHLNIILEREEKEGRKRNMLFPRWFDTLHLLPWAGSIYRLLVKNSPPGMESVIDVYF